MVTGDDSCLELSGDSLGGTWTVTAEGYGVSLGGDENVLKLG
jgi:hypothetical protein